MSLIILKINMKIFLCVILCQCVLSESVKNVTYVQYDNVQYDSIVFNTDDNDYVNEIVGRKYRKSENFPYMAMVHRLIYNGVIEQCSGTILSKRWVLTAGHCVAKYPQRFFVTFGLIEKFDVGYDYLLSFGVSMITSQAILHPQYNKTTNNIALLHMPCDIPFCSTIQPVTLGSYIYADESFANKKAYVIGWGKVNQDIRYHKYATSPIIANDECKLYWRVTDKHICTAPGLGQNICQGNSGGPLIVVENGRDLQVGVVSYGDAFCPSNLPAIFTRVSSFTKWIHKITKI